MNLTLVAMVTSLPVLLGLQLQRFAGSLARNTMTSLWSDAGQHHSNIDSQDTSTQYQQKLHRAASQNDQTCCGTEKSQSPKSLSAPPDSRNYTQNGVKLLQVHSEGSLNMWEHRIGRRPVSFPHLYHLCALTTQLVPLPMSPVDFLL